MTNSEFTIRLIKGRIAETLFEQMFRENEKFSIRKLGYEYTSPELAQFQHHLKNKKVLDKIRSAPDFLLITTDMTQAYLVEVKFRNKLDPADILKAAEKAAAYTDPSFLFIATPTGFYFDLCTRIISNGGQIQRLSESWIPRSVQQEYLILLNTFEPRSMVNLKLKLPFKKRFIRANNGLA